MHKELEMQQLSNKDFRCHVYKGLLAPHIVKVNRTGKSEPRYPLLLSRGANHM
jgi:hypothetical protein